MYIYILFLFIFNIFSTQKYRNIMKNEINYDFLFRMFFKQNLSTDFQQSLLNY